MAVAPYFSTLDSGLRDETKVRVAIRELTRNFSTLDSGLRDETEHAGGVPLAVREISVPSTRVYAMKQAATRLLEGWHSLFQYPRLGSTR